MGKSDPLSTYNAKRNFKRTAEPAGTRSARRGSNSFVVQKHDATRLHWDFRIEIDGVLKSWAVTKGPSLDPDIKRLAVRTEDHPLAYGGFEGTIPKGEYGGGTVMLWDRGTWDPIPSKSASDLDRGHLHFTLTGERMQGEWILIRLKPRSKETRENWLLRKVADAYMTSLTRQYSGKDFAVVTINVDRSRALADAFLRKMGGNLPVVYDASGALAKQYKVKDMPTSFLIDRTGRIRFTHKGFHPKEVAAYKAHIDQLINER